MLRSRAADPSIRHTLPGIRLPPCLATHSCTPASPCTALLSHVSGRYWSWFSRIDFLRYSWGALMVNNYEDDNPVFTGEDTTVLDYYNMMGVNK